MAHDIKERPHVFSMSKNEIRYVYQLNNLTRAGLYLEVKLFYQKGNITNQIGDSFKLKPNKDGFVYFYCNGYIDSVLSFTIPDFTKFKTPAFNQYCFFWIETREVDDSLTDVWNVAEVTKQRTAIKMGIEKHRFSRNNFFNYRDTYKLPLTWHSSGRYIFANQPNILTVFMPSASYDGKTMEITYYSVDDINTVLTTTITLQGLDALIMHFNLSLSNLNIQLAPGKLYKFSIAIYNAGSEYFLDNYTFFIDYRNFYVYWDLFYFNSLGGIDPLRINGEMNETLEFSQIEAEGGFSLNEWKNTNKTPDFTNYSTFIRKFKGDIGFTDTKNEQLVKAELFNSPAIFMFIDDHTVRINSLSKSADLGKKTDDLSSLPIEWQIAEENDVYTPDFIQLGVGSDIETYP